jgi:hypothetical protein
LVAAGRDLAENDRERAWEIDTSHQPCFAID